MGSKNLTEEGQRKKLLDPRRATLERKCHELVEKCQADVALFIRPYNEDKIFAYQSRPDFPDINSSSTIVLRTPDDHISKAQHLQTLTKVDATDETRTFTTCKSLGLPEEPSSTYIDPNLCEQPQPVSGYNMDTMTNGQYTFPFEQANQPFPLESVSKTNAQLNISVPPSADSSTLFVSPRTPVTPNRPPRRRPIRSEAYSRRRNHRGIGGLRRDGN